MAEHFGLYVRPRLYRCRCCGHEHPVSTNHTAQCFSVCPSCSWRGAWDDEGRLWNATEKNRPHVYVGPEVTDAERNPHAK